jgi:hypothetical protein
VITFLFLAKTPPDNRCLFGICLCALTDIKLAAYDWFYWDFGGFLSIFERGLIFGLGSFVMVKDIAYKMKRAHQIGVVGNCDRRHLLLNCGLNERGHTDRGLQHRKLRVVVQVDEVDTDEQLLIIGKLFVWKPAQPSSLQIAGGFYPKPP